MTADNIVDHTSLGISLDQLLLKMEVQIYQIGSGNSIYDYGDYIISVLWKLSIEDYSRSKSLTLITYLYAGKFPIRGGGLVVICLEHQF